MGKTLIGSKGSRALLGNRNAAKLKVRLPVFNYRSWCAARARELVDRWFMMGGNEPEINGEELESALREAYSRGFGDATTRPHKENEHGK